LAGPLVEPSANPEGLPPAETVDEARKYFGESADFYVDGGRRSGRPSALVSLADGTPKILRGQVGLRV
jgi:L-threonylcarbamoyladenylate synthase